MNKRVARSAKEDSDSGLRERIMRASVALIEAEGLAQLSMREVARRAGVTHQAPYHYFADREAILGAIAEEGFSLLQARMASACAVAAAESATVPQTLCATGRAYVEFACEHSAHFRIMFRPELVDPENCPGLKHEGDCTFNRFIEIVHGAVEAGLPAYPSEPALIALMWSVAHGLACLIVDGPLERKLPGVPLDVQIHQVLTALERMLEASMEASAGANSARPRGTAKARKRSAPRRKRTTA